MRTSLCDLPQVLVDEIFSKVPFKSLGIVRSTCTTWNALSRNQFFAAKKNQSLGFTVINSRLFSLKFDLRDDDEEDLVSLSIKRVSMFNHVDINNVFHCDGLLLCIIKDNKWPVVWNPFLGETKLIKPIHELHKFHKSDMFAFGYDSNRKHKILRFLNVLERPDLPEFFEIYDFNSDSWRVLDDIDPKCQVKGDGVSLKGNTYFFAREKIDDILSPYLSLLCFDFSSERFGPCLSLPYCSHLPFLEDEPLSCVRDEHLAVLYKRYDAVIMIWITTEIEPNRVSWSSFLKVDLKLSPGRIYGESFFVYEEKKVAMVVDFIRSGGKNMVTTWIIGEEGYVKSVRLREASDLSSPGHYNPLVISSYVPSFVQLHNNQGRKRKERDYYMAWGKGVTRLELEVDSEIVVRFLLMGIEDTHPLSFLAHLCYGLISKDWEVRFTHVYREANHLADGLANYAFSLPLGFHSFEHPLECVSSFLVDDTNGVIYTRRVRM